MIADNKDVKKRMRWVKTFKKHCGIWNREKIKCEILSNLEKMGLVKKYKLFTNLQDLWADTDKKRRCKFESDLKMALTMRFFKQFSKNKDAKWKYSTEEQYMKEMKLRYNNKANDMERSISRQASRSMSDVIKSICKKGKSIHGHIICIRGLWSSNVDTFAASRKATTASKHKLEKRQKRRTQTCLESMYRSRIRAKKKEAMKLECGGSDTDSDGSTTDDDDSDDLVPAADAQTATLFGETAALLGEIAKTGIVNDVSEIVFQYKCDSCSTPS